MAEPEKKGFTLYLDSKEKEEIENYFLEHKIKNYSLGYKHLISLGFEQFKKKGGKVSG